MDNVIFSAVKNTFPLYRKAAAKKISGKIFKKLMSNSRNMVRL